MSSEDQAEPIADNDQFRTLDRHAQETQTQDRRSDVIEAVPPIYMRGAIYLFIAVLIVSLVLTYVGKVFVIVPVQGQIIPEGQNVVVEAESQGVVTDVLVSPGDEVEAGQIILELRQSGADVGLESANSALDIQFDNREKAQAAILAINRIVAQPSLAATEPLDSFKDAGAALVHITGLRSAILSLDQAHQNLDEEMERQGRVTRNQIELQQSTINRLRANMGTARSAVRTQQQSVTQKEEALARIVELAEKRIVPQTQVNTAREAVLTAQNSLNEKRQQIGQLQLQISQAEVEIGNLEASISKQETDLKAQVANAQLSYDRSVADLSSSIATFQRALQLTDAQIKELQGKIRIQKDSIQKLSIRSPVSGSVTALNFNTAGQSVGAGSKVAVIVPKNVRPIVYATVPNKDIADIKVGIGARVKVDAYPFRQYGTVTAEVVRVFPLADQPVFGVRLQLKKAFIEKDGIKEPLEPGLTVNIDLLTKRKRIIQLIFKQWG